VENRAEEDRERDGSTSSSTTWRTCSSTWRMPRIELNGEGEGEPVWLTPHLRDPQPEGERERECSRPSRLVIVINCVQKNGPTLKRYSSKLYKSILLIFGRNIQRTLE